jgi:hypothetical protein
MSLNAMKQILIYQYKIRRAEQITGMDKGLVYEWTETGKTIERTTGGSSRRMKIKSESSK